MIIYEEYLLDPDVNNWIQEYYDKLVSGEVKPVFAEVSVRLRRLTIHETKRIQTFLMIMSFAGLKLISINKLEMRFPVRWQRL